MTSKTLVRGSYVITDKVLPLFFHGNVVHGFGRGSKQLGIPTANLPIEEYEEILKDVPVGVYHGWANVQGGPVHKMAMSIGWNPYFKNTKKTIEIHLLHDFTEDFYGQHLNVIALGYIRPMCDFTSLDDLIAGIKGDIDYAKEQLEQPQNQQYKTNPFFQTVANKDATNGHK